MNLPILATRIIGVPLMVSGSRLDVILSAIGPRIGIGADVAAKQADFVDDQGKKYKKSGLIIDKSGIAIIQIHGTLTKRLTAMDAMSGDMVTYGEIENMVLEAATDSTVKGIMLDIDSPGGEVGDVFDVMNTILEAGEIKPIWAVLNDAFSGGYALASCAKRLFIPQAAGTGSIGVIAVHVDVSGADKKAGRSYTTLTAGKFKGDFSSHKPLENDARERLQAEVDRLYGLFVSSVAINRNMTEQEVRAQEAGVFFGEGAVTAKLADQVGTLREALDELSSTVRVTGNHQGSKTRTRQSSMEASKPVTEENTTAATVIPPQAAAPSADDAGMLDKAAIVAQTQQEMQIINQEIVDLCALAGTPEMALDFITKGVSVRNVRKALLEIRSEGIEIQSHINRGTGASADPAINLEQNPLVLTCKNRAGQGG